MLLLFIYLLKSARTSGYLPYVTSVQLQFRVNYILLFKYQNVLKKGQVYFLPSVKKKRVIQAVEDGHIKNKNTKQFDILPSTLLMILINKTYSK